MEEKHKIEIVEENSEEAAVKVIAKENENDITNITDSQGSVSRELEMKEERPSSRSNISEGKRRESRAESNAESFGLNASQRTKASDLEAFDDGEKLKKRAIQRAKLFKRERRFPWLKILLLFGVLAIVAVFSLVVGGKVYPRFLCSIVVKLSY